MGGKGNPRSERVKASSSRQASEKASSPQLQHDDGEKNDPSLATVIELIETFRSESRASMDTLQSSLDSFGSRLTEAETALQLCDDRITALESKCAALESSNKKLVAKTEDLESRSRRQNLRVLGIPEKMEGPQVTSFMTKFFTEVVNIDLPPDGPEMLDRAHRIASRPSGANAPPRPIIVRVHQYGVMQRILQLSREKGPLTFRGNRVHIFPDFTTEVGKQRASFNNIKQKLRAANVKYGLLFPARLQVSFDNKRHSFDTPEEAEKFYAENIAPGQTAEGADA